MTLEAFSHSMLGFLSSTMAVAEVILAMSGFLLVLGSVCKFLHNPQETTENYLAVLKLLEKEDKEKL